MEYKYVDLPITPGITEELIIKLLNGQTLDRNSIVKIIIEKVEQPILKNTYQPPC